MSEQPKIESRSPRSALGSAEGPMYSGTGDSTSESGASDQGAAPDEASGRGGFSELDVKWSRAELFIGLARALSLHSERERTKRVAQFAADYESAVENIVFGRLAQ